jgi:hypothetical protein
MWKRLLDFAQRTDAAGVPAGERWRVRISGAVAAACLLVWCEQLVGLLGTSLTTAATMSAALAIGAWLGTTVLASRARRFASTVTIAGIHLLLAAQAVAMPWLLEVINGLISRPGLMGLHGSGRNGAILLGLFLVVLGIPSMLIAWSATVLQAAANHASHGTVARFLFGACWGLLLAGGVFAPVIGWQYTALIAAANGVALALTYLFQQREPQLSPACAEISTAETNWFSAATRGILAICFGGMIAALCRLLDQLFPATVYVLCSCALGVAAGAATGLWWCARRADAKREDHGSFHLAVCLAASVWCTAIVAAFPWLVEGALWLTAYVASTPLLLAARGAAAAIALFPVGLAAAVCLGRMQKDANQAPIGAAAIRFLAPVGGYWLGAGALLTSIGVVPTVWLCAWLCFCAASGAWLRRATLPQRRFRQIAAAGATALVAAAPFLGHAYRPQVAARTLFNTRVFLAYRTGVDTSLLMSLDDGRLAETVEGNRGTLTAWKHAGNQLQLRENGMPKGTISLDSALFPQFAPELLQTALPLVLHERPQRLLVLGLGSGEAVSAGLTFPLQQIVCIEEDAALIALVHEALRKSSQGDPLADDRLKLRHGDPVLTAGMGQGKFDVVVSVLDQPALARTQASLCREFYARAAQSLTADGVFCQRLQFIDLGPDAVRVVVSTMQSVFSDQMAVEVAPGELLILGTNSPRGLVRSKLVARLQHPHVRRTLAEVGLDWSVLLNLAALNSKSLEQFAHDGAARPNSAAAGSLACRLPRDVARWSAKLEEMQVATANRAGRLLNWLPEEENGPEIVRRLAEIKGQQDLMTRYSDQYWAYRASVRDQLTHNQRSPIRQVSLQSSGDKLHPDDRRRLNYFTALGRAVKSGSAEDIREVAAFESPYDPLLSYFLHREVAELFSESSDRQPAEELRHRLHSTYFSSPRDGSVKNVIDTLRLLYEHPEAEPDPVKRWDVLNGLLQALQGRWEARIGVKPKDATSLVNDINQSIGAAEITFKTMESLTAEAGLPPDHWTARRAVLEKSLIRPLRTYRGEVMPHVLKARAKEAIVDEAAEAKGDSPQNITR